MIKKFYNTAKLIRNSREAAGISQTELSERLGYKNGQFISNVERSLCKIPAKKIVQASVILKIDYMKIIDAMVSDERFYLHNASLSHVPTSAL